MIKVDWIRVVYTKDRGRYYGYVETDRGCTSVETREEFDFHRGFLVPWRKGNIYLPNVDKLLDYYNNRRTDSLWVSLRGKTRPDERYKGYIIHDKGIIYDQENRIPDKNRYAVYPDRPGERYEIFGRVQRLMMGAEEENRPLNMDEIKAIRENMAAIVLHPNGLSQIWLPGLVDDVRKAMDNYNERF